MIHTEVELFIIIWLNYSIRCIYSVYIFFFSCICINYSVLWRISTRWESATGISNRKIFCSTRNLAFLSSVILVPPNIWSKGSPMCLTSVVVTIARPNWSLVLLIILQKSVCLSLLIEFRLKFLSRFLSIYRDIVIIRLIGLLLNKIQFFFFSTFVRNQRVFTDVWSAGCVVAELLLGQPIFPGDSGVDQLVEIIKVLGTPTRDQIREMNPNYTEFKFPQIKAHPWQKVAHRLV